MGGWGGCCSGAGMLSAGAFGISVKIVFEGFLTEIIAKNKEVTIKVIAAAIVNFSSNPVGPPGPKTV